MWGERDSEMGLVTQLGLKWPRCSLVEVNVMSSRKSRNCSSLHFSGRLVVFAVTHAPRPSK